MSLSKDSQSRVHPTLEDLLRLKRAEKPDAAFWQDFERGMRQKQLAAIIEPRPWWLGLSMLSRRIGPFGMPISAAAAAMLALVVMRVSPVGGLTQAVSSSSPEPVAVASAAPSLASAVVSSNPSPVASSPGTVAVRPLAQTVAQEQRVASVKTVPVNESAPINSTPTSVASALVTAPSKGALSLNAEAAVVAIANKAPVVNAMAPSSSSALNVQLLVSAAPALENAMPEANAASFALAGDEAQADKAGLNPRQARLLSNATKVAEDKSLASVREQVLHRLADDEARYATISRVDVNADRLSLKF